MAWSNPKNKNAASGLIHHRQRLNEKKIIFVYVLQNMFFSKSSAGTDVILTPVSVHMQYFDQDNF